MTKDRVIEKLAKIRAHQENAETLGNLAEAEVFAKKMQDMLHQHELSLSDIQFQQEVNEEVNKEYVDWKDTSIGPKHRRCNWMEDMCSLVAEANGCAILVSAGSNRIIFVGHDANRKIAIYTAKVLVQAAHRMSEEAYLKYYTEVFRFDGNGDKAKGYRASWLNSFICRIQERYHERKRKAQQEQFKGGDTSTSTSTALVRIDAKAAKVEEFLSDVKTAPTLDGAKGGGNRQGARDGRQTANDVDIDGKGVETSKPKENFLDA